MGPLLLWLLACNAGVGTVKILKSTADFRKGRVNSRADINLELKGADSRNYDWISQLNFNLL